MLSLTAFLTSFSRAPRRMFVLGSLGVVAVVAVPVIAVAALVLNGVALFAQLLIHVGAVATGGKVESSPKPPPWSRPPMVSIHVPICSEPPAVVNATLDALAGLSYSDFEVIVLDNNTADARLWRPVREHCRRLGPRFRFVHVRHLEGAKAGALNRCLELTDPAAELIAVVDADYQVAPDWLAHAVRRLGPRAYLQYPQAYRDTDGKEGLERDYAHYFEAHMQLAERWGAPLLTGTMCVIRRDAVARVGGWSSRTITEDAELGLRLIGSGLLGSYVHHVAGRGLMPTALGALRGQRRRWVHGNAQTLFGLRWSGLRSLGPRRAIAVVGQLTAWFNFLLLPMAVVSILALVPELTPLHHAALGLATASICLHLLGGGFLRLLAPETEISTTRDSAGWKRLRAHLALVGVGAIAWLEPLLGVELGFCTTDKSGAVDGRCPLRWRHVLWLVPVVAWVSFAVRGESVGVIGATGVALVAWSTFSLRAAMRRSGSSKEIPHHVQAAV